MQIDNTQRAGIITASTIVGAGAGATIAHYMPMVNNKGEATTDRFVKEVAKEMTGEKAYKLVTAASAKDYLDTIYLTRTNFYPTPEQVDKFYNRYGDFLEISPNEMKDNKGKDLKGKALKERLYAVIDEKIAKNGEVAFSEDGKELKITVANATEAEAKSLIKNGFNKKKLVKAGETISEEGLSVLKSAMKTVKNERMLKGGIIAGLVGLAGSVVATCQRD